MTPSQGTQALSRAFKVLKIVAQNGGEATLNHLITKSGLNRTTTYRLAMGLAAEGMLRSVSGSFVLGPECYMLGIIANQYYGINGLAADAVSRLALKSGDSAFFSLRSDRYSVCLLREDGDHPLKTMSLQPGTRHPLGIGAGGIAILAVLPDKEIDEILYANTEIMRISYPNFTAGSIKIAVSDARAKGYSFNKGKLTPGSWGIGVDIKDPRGNVLGALSISAVLMRLQEERQKELSALLHKEKLLLEEKLRQAESPR
ncbi:IclR family transcriptional regulator [Mucilaginibacter ginkgonis]|uniref:IclR family transcriptional regulator n=1 Tax=Mucilaginibacter ginkgonis TaxID=2682091 RepID=A0A6I4HXU0_9SPHI|nr:IclR family transcriptional regulator [Mucilaginibacter ginkgonis]QQL49478.1 IclR family transcriptional regulator [Mucilaginibacter ginkgonis]